MVRASRSEDVNRPGASTASSLLTDISSNHLSLLAWALRRNGMDVDAIFAQAGAYIPQTNTPLDRVPLATVGRILRIVQTTTDDPCAPLKIYRSMKLTHFDALGVALSCSGTLMEFFERGQRFCSYVGPVFAIEIRQDPASCTIQGSYSPALRDGAGRAIDDAQLLMQCIAFAALGLLEDLFDAPVPIQCGFLAGKPHSSIVKTFETALGAPVTTGADFIGAQFDRTVLAAPLPGANPNLGREIDRLLTAQLAEIEREDIVRKTEQLIMQCMPLGEVSLKQIAQKIGASESSLRRQLVKRGVNFSDLVVGIKKTLAIQHLQEGKMRVSEIAFLLGFDSPSNFSRAFRSWAGCSPREYKNQ